MMSPNDASHRRNDTRLASLHRSAAVLCIAVLSTGLLWESASEPIPVQEAPAPTSTAFDAQAVARVLESANPLLTAPELERVSGAVIRYSAKYGLDPELVTAILLVESGARPWARSHKGAMGLMQVMPHMMEPLGLAGNAATIESNIEAGCWILASNIARLGEERGISAYFWGSEIRGVAYLERVREARASLRLRQPS